MKVRIVFKTGIVKEMNIRGHDSFRDFANNFYKYEFHVFDDIGFAVKNVDFIEEIKD